jgi:hypothetical protein
MVASWRAKSATDTGRTEVRQRVTAASHSLAIRPRTAVTPPGARFSMWTGVSCEFSSVRSTSSSEAATSMPSWARPLASRAR